jgi:hypothetical protein
VVLLTLTTTEIFFSISSLIFVSSVYSDGYYDLHMIGSVVVFNGIMCRPMSRSPLDDSFLGKCDGLG